MVVDKFVLNKNLLLQQYVSALRIFLNAEHGLSRSLLVQLLSGLWNIQKWARSQRSMKLYASSILLAYDARYLRNNLELQKKSKLDSPTGPMSKSPRMPSLADNSPKSPFNWPNNSESGDRSPNGTTMQAMYKQVQRSHSAQNNYDEVRLFVSIEIN